jgi:hypothetical protein
MQTNKRSLSALGVLVLAALLVIGAFKIQQAAAQVDATSSDAVVASSTDSTPATDVSTTTAADATATPLVLGASTSASPNTDAVSSPATTTPAVSATPTELPPQGLAEVHIIGTKYIDYFTDGTTVTSYPGDPKIDSNFDKPNAPIPTHEGLTWDHTVGQYLYDTPSGDLELGDYAVQANGSYIANAPPFVSSTSTPAVLGESTSTADTPTDITSTSTSTPAPTDITAPTTTSTDSTTTSSNQ